MTTRSNLHTHCTYCDGKDTMQAMVQAAIEAGFSSIGFSSHGRTNYDDDECQIASDRIDDYFAEIKSLNEKYQDKIRIYSGVELESLVLGKDGNETRPEIDPRCDYSIGSAHYIRNNGNHYTIDYRPEDWLEGCKTFKSPLEFLKTYFEDYLDFALTVPFDIVGHIDVYTKNNQKTFLFDDTDKKYKTMVLDYVDQIAGTGKIFEINTGAMGKGYRTDPYPARFILERLNQLNAPIILSSDSHAVSTIAYAFDQCEQMLKDIGFKEQMMLTDKGFIPVAL